MPDRVDFNLHIKPILSDRCFKCHGPDDNAREAEFRLDTEEGAYARLSVTKGKRGVVPGSLRRSQVFHRLVSQDPEYMMPPPESNLTISPEEIALIARWIEQGAEYKPHWAFIPPERPEVPQVEHGNWPVNEIDHFVLARLEEKGWQPSEEAVRETLIRRVSFDLTGLPPTPEEVRAFVADNSPDAYEKVVDRLLETDAYAERMTSDWLDAARYADSHGFQDDGMRNMWPWRDWVISAFQQNMPYDQFITWQLAGDLLPDPTTEQILATGFNRNHMQSQEGGIVPEEYRVEYVADRTNTVATVLTGMTMECARCHDHKYDPISIEEYYQFFAFFNNVNEIGQIPYAGEASPTVILKDEETEAKLAALHEEMVEYERLTDIHSPAFDDDFKEWLERLEAGETVADPEPDGLLAHYPLDEITEFEYANTVERSRPATLSGDRDKLPETIEGKFGDAQRLVGDSYITVGDELAHFERNEPFTIGLWINILTEGEAGPIFSKSGGLMNGLRGYDCMLREDGTLTASLNHVGPDNSIEIETIDTVPSNGWNHLVMTYDGSSRAEGIKLFLNGAEMSSRVVTDNLKKSILHYREGNNWGGGGNLSLGKRGDETMDHLGVDEFRVYDRRLTALEVAKLSGAEDPVGEILAVASGQRSAAQRSALRDYYVSTQHPQFRQDFRKLTELRGEENKILTPLPEVMVLRERKHTRPTFILDRGMYDSPTDQVEPATPAVMNGFREEWPRNRLGLAKWLMDPDHPLTARVTANRYWQMHFGRGLVSTPEDFGNQGALPSHPELLDWLATEFVASGWDLKALHKKIVMSATFRQSSVVTPEIRDRDPDNVYLARGPSYRLPAEMIRDNALAVSGLLVPEIGGPSVYPYQPEGLWEALATRNVTVYEQGTGDDLYRRSLYTIWKRTSPPPAMLSFDASERNICSVKRQSTSTPLQALVLMNDPQYIEAARIIAERMVKEGGDDLDERINFAFELLTSRRPLERESRVLAALYEDQLEDFTSNRSDALDLLAVGEYPRDRQLDPPEVAALTMVASTIMNFDETIFKR